MTVFMLACFVIANLPVGSSPLVCCYHLFFVPQKRSSVVALCQQHAFSAKDYFHFEETHYDPTSPLADSC